MIFSSSKEIKIMSTKKLQISSGQFGELSQNILTELKNDHDFLDVTLVCEGDKQILAHKVVLASFSLFFKNILRNNPHQHPLIYLKGLDMEDLKAIISFIYTGEVTVNEESLDKILRSSRDLEIKGLFEDQIESGKVEPEHQPEPQPEPDNDNHIKSDNLSCVENNDDEFKDFDFITNIIKTEEEEIVNDVVTTSSVQCDDLEKDDTNVQNDTKIKKERIYSCDQCEYTASHSALMWRHKSTAHMNQSFPCDQCSHTTNRKDSLLRHRRNRHGLNVSL